MLQKIKNNKGVKVSLLTVIINFGLFLLKFIVGLIGHSQAIISDAFHSLSDVITTIGVIMGLIFASKDADRKHPYGHERIESMMAIILSFILLLSGLSIGFFGLKTIFSQDILIVPSVISLIAAVVSILVKEGMFHYTMKIAKEINSASMEADAWHHRSDALSSIGSFLGILASRLGFPILDPLCSVLICILIIKTAIEIFMTATNQMIDTSCDDATTKDITATIQELCGNLKLNDIKTRMFGTRCYIDVEIAMDGSVSLKEANDIALKIHNKVEAKFPIVKHCNIHVIPFE